MLTYLCKYTPVELLTAFGSPPEAPNREAADFDFADTVIHPNVCSHAKMLIGALRGLTAACPGCSDCPDARGRKELVLTNCCDSIRRVIDSMDLSGMDFTCMLDLPHTDSAAAVRLYAAELARFAESYGAHAGRAFDRGVLLAEWRKAAETWRRTEEGGEPFAAVLGARVPDELYLKLSDGLDLPLVDLTCGGARTLPAPPEDILRKAEEGALTDAELFAAYAAALLAQIPCTRMRDVGERGRLTRIPGLAGIVYETVRFCDYYGFEFAQVVKDAEVPVLKIESDYTDQSSGQLATRIQAYNETLREKYGTRAKTRGADRGAGPESGLPGGYDMNENERIYVGIDSGSTTTNIAALDGTGRLLASLTLRTGAKAGPAAERAFGELKRQLAAAGHDPARICRITATGYGRESITFADDVKTEISCHAKGAHYMDPAARTIIDIGGQDSKVISLDDQGNVKNFIMNDKCAAGTGRFLENMARTLEMSTEELADAGRQWKKDLTISSTCTVFAESEVVSLVAENAETPDIIHALNKAVAKKTAAMALRLGGEPPYLMTGGVARNPGVAAALSEGVGAPVKVAEHPDLAGAVGAALYAMA